MSKIYVSPETMEKMSTSDDYSEVLNHFDPNRPEPKRTIQKKDSKLQVTKQRDRKVEPEKELRRSLKLLKRKLSKIRQRHHIDLQKSDNTSRKKTTTKPLMGDIAEHRLPKNIGQPTTFSYSPSPRKSVKTNYLRAKTPRKKSNTNLSYLKEHYLLAECYVPKSTDLKRKYAEIKAKNNATLSNCRKAKKNKHKRDWTDRFALK